MRKLHSNSFAARLTPGQCDELFTALAGGLGYSEAAVKVYEWTKENSGDRTGLRSGGALKIPPRSSIHSWYQARAAEQRYEAAKQVAIVAQANCPANYDEQARRALGQARFLATLEGLRVSDIASLEKNELAREKLALEREKLASDTRHRRRELVLDQTRVLLKRARGGEKGPDLQRMIDLALEEIEKMKRGEE